jgi:hypothetical protein
MLHRPVQSANRSFVPQDDKTFKTPILFQSLDILLLAMPYFFNFLLKHRILNLFSMHRIISSIMQPPAFLT